jgi:hypothetical protein
MMGPNSPTFTLLQLRLQRVAPGAALTPELDWSQMRVKQPADARGSLRWVRHLIYDHPAQLSDALLPKLGVSAATIRWVSPRSDDEHAEYRDQCALDQLGVSCGVRALADFWPNRGPQWDALGRFGNAGVVLVEAKANLSELVSPASQASGGSLAKIERACVAAQTWFRTKREFLGWGSIISTQTA